MYASDQEKELHALFAWALGNPNVYRPKLYQTSSGHDEPADLVWVEGDNVTLIYLCRKEASEVRPRATPDSEKAAKHNIDQAAKWLRRWKGNPGFSPPRPLPMTNTYEEREVSFDSVKNVTVLSIIDTVHAFARQHPELTSKYNITDSLTMPQSAVASLFQNGGNFGDFRWLVDEVRERGELSFDAIANLVDDYVVNAWNTAKLTRHWPARAIDYRFTDLAEILHSFRHVADPVGPAPMHLHRIIGSLELMPFLCLLGLARDELSSYLYRRRHGAFAPVSSFEQFKEQMVQATKILTDSSFYVTAHTALELSEGYTTDFWNYTPDSQVGVSAKVPWKPSALVVDGNLIFVSVLDVMELAAVGWVANLAETQGCDRTVLINLIATPDALFPLVAESGVVL
jgi:hypothetical protein